jgi:hypothetical protein
MIYLNINLYKSASLLVVVTLIAVTSNPVAAANYYVSPTGSDSNNGTSTNTPWQTIGQVNRFVFSPGDHVYFQEGQSFTGCVIFSHATNVPVSSASTPFVVGSYGTGNATLLSNCPGVNQSNGNGPRSALVTIDGISGFVLNKLILSANGTATQFGVLIENSGGGTASSITVENSDISGFYTTAMDSSSEIYVTGYPLNGNCPGNLDQVNIVNNTLHGVSGPTSPDDNGIIGLSCGLNVTNVIYQGNTVYDLGGGGAFPNQANGIVAIGVSRAQIQYNIVHDIGGNTTSCGGSGGIWAYTSSNIAIQFNEVYNVQPISYTTGCDWNAFDLDGGVSNSVVQYNYSHHDFGAAYLAYVANVNGYPTWGNNIFRYNISENDAYGIYGSGQGVFNITQSPPAPLQIYNNTIYVPSEGNANNPWTFTFCYAGGGSVAWAAGSLIENNICYINSTFYVPFVNFPYLPTATGINWANNDWYTPTSGPRLIWNLNGSQYNSLAAWQAGCNCDSSASAANPLLTAPGTGGTLSWTASLENGPQPGPTGYQLQPSSPVKSIGADLLACPSQPTYLGARDYFGNSIANLCTPSRASARPASTR